MGGNKGFCCPELTYQPDRTEYAEARTDNQRNVLKWHEVGAANDNEKTEEKENATGALRLNQTAGTQYLFEFPPPLLSALRITEGLSAFRAKKAVHKTGMLKLMQSSGRRPAVKRQEFESITTIAANPERAIARSTCPGKH